MKEYKIKKLNLVIIAIGISLLCSCATNSKLNFVDSHINLPITAKYKIGEIKDSSNFVSEEDINIVKLMRDALFNKLSKLNLIGTGYKINIVIIEYKPGNAFQRWLVPGWGETYLKIKSTIIDPDGSEIVEIPVERSIAAGGGFTIGAWKACFDDVAGEIVKLIKNEMEK